MNIINGNPFNGNYIKAGSFGPACSGGATSCGCGCGCGCCGCGCGCGCCGCGCCCPQPRETFIPTPQYPFPCVQGCANQGRVDWSGCDDSRGPCSGSCDNHCSACAQSLDTLLNPCYGLPAIRAELDDLRCAVGDIYSLIAPVPYPCPCSNT